MNQSFNRVPRQAVPSAVVSTDAIPRFAEPVDRETLAEALREHGLAIVERAAPESLATRVQHDLAPYLERVLPSQGTFMGLRTRRTGRLVAKSAACRELMLHPMVLGALELAFDRGCYDFQLHGTSASRIEPGESAQSLHRDDSVFPFLHPSPPNSFVCVWAIDEFRKENGATRVIPGSHLWDDATTPDETQCQFAEMPRGSLLIFDAALYHGAGANTSEQSRTGVLISYSLGWLRQEENQFLAVPPALAKTLPQRLRELVGYKNHGFLGHFELGSPERALAESVQDVYPAEDLYTEELERIGVRRR